MNGARPQMQAAFHLTRNNETAVTLFDGESQ
jgi:hypothetical protein